MDPYDIEKLKEELACVKKELHSEKEASRLLKASQEQYKKRAYYAKNKFYEAQEKLTDCKEVKGTDADLRLKNT